MKTHNDICISRGKVLVIHVFAGILMALCFGLIFGYFIMLLWNSLLPDILGLKEITYWQGTGLVIMFRLLFGSHGYHKQGQPFKKYQTHRVSQQYQGSSTRRDYYQAWWQTEGAEALRKYIENQDRCSK
jgi:uncharacterized membrane protein YraQ (UPF0718 family)